MKGISRHREDTGVLPFLSLGVGGPFEADKEVARLQGKCGLEGLQLALVPRGANTQPRPMIFGRQGTARALQLLAKDNLWKTITIPAGTGGALPTAVAGVRIGSSSYIVVQYTTAAKVTSYKSVLVPAAFL